MPSLLRRAAVAALVVALPAAAGAQNTTFRRDLPTLNINDAAGPSRSNVAWSQGDGQQSDYISGDTYALGASPQGAWRINSLTVWSAVGPERSAPFEFGDYFSDLRLYFGDANTGISLFQSGTFATGSSASANPNVTVTRVQYANGDDYQQFGPFYRLYQITFNNLGYVTTGSGAFGVAAGVRFPGSLSTDFSLHASSRTLSGGTQDGADDLLLFWDDVAGTPTIAGPATRFCSQSGGSVDGVDCYAIWDKNSDYNVLIEATAVPEPSTYALLGAGLAGVAAAARRRRTA